MREGPDNEAAAVVEATVFRARAGSLHDLACPCGVSAQSPPCISCRGFLHLSPTDVRQWRRCR